MLISCVLSLLVTSACSGSRATGKEGRGEAQGGPPAALACTVGNTVRAEVVALDQIYFYNRFGAFNPAGMIYALSRDVVVNDDAADGSGSEAQRLSLSHDFAKDRALAGKVSLRPDKRPRPLVLRMHEGDCLEVSFTNLLAPAENGQERFNDPGRGAPVADSEGQPVLDNEFRPDAVDRKSRNRDGLTLDSEEPRTRHASLHINGLDYVPGDRLFDAAGHPLLASDGANVGNNVSSLAAPGQTRIYRWYAKPGSSGSYLFYSMGAPAGGEGDGGQLGLGLFGSVNIEPPGSVWYRSQVTADDLKQVTRDHNPHGGPVLDYGATLADGPRKGDPVLRMLNDRNELVYGDLNAVIDNRRQGDGRIGEDCSRVAPGTSCGEPFREFTTIFHDELTAVQAYPELEDEADPISALKDNMGINYGAAGLGSMVLANRKGIGPAKDCKECKLEEFFLTSWANGDPALVVMTDPATGKGVRALYPDDPSNVHHSYMGDPVRFRTMHAGPKETHVFHLHAHQWLRDRADPHSHYLDSQTISPGASFTYDILYGGSGNRNLTPGDSIFHCHLYPHFAQGMWELWRVHDVFEDGSRSLPDGELGRGTDPATGMTAAGTGTPIPAVVPLPGFALAPVPTYSAKDGAAAMPGYPFYVAAKAGHRPPQAPYDIAVRGTDSQLCRNDPANANCLDGGLPRHFVYQVPDENDPAGPGYVLGLPAVGEEYRNEAGAGSSDLYDRGRALAGKNANTVFRKNGNGALWSLALKLREAKLQLLPWEGDAGERSAMDFHAGVRDLPNNHHLIDRKVSGFQWSGKGYDSCDAEGHCTDKVFLVNGLPPKAGAPFADPCPQTYHDGNPDHPDLPVAIRQYRGAYLQFDMTVNRWGWHDPQARIAVLEQDVKNTLNGRRAPEPLFMRANSNECVEFSATNLVPSNLNLDDFQVFTPTDTIGQHIHLVKFDVMASDGSGNGFNYEDGTLAADEVRERIQAFNRWLDHHGGMVDGHPQPRLKPKTHPMFAVGGAMEKDARGICPDDPRKWDDHPWCGAQATAQRWWTDPVQDWDTSNHQPQEYLGKDRTLRTVFTHDHFGPSSHQHHGFYAALVVEPQGSQWRSISPNVAGEGGKRGRAENAFGDLLGGREDGGPTSYAAQILKTPSSPKPCADKDDCRREFNLAFADFAIVYDKDQHPVNAENRIEKDLPIGMVHAAKPAPQGISGGDPGTQLLNYRNEPIPLRVGEPVGKGRWAQKRGETGDMANVFSSAAHAAALPPLKLPAIEPEGVRKPGDPATPVLYACEGENVQVRLIQGAQEEQHVFTMHGARWLAEPDSPDSGYMNAQQLGISEHFEFDMEFSRDPFNSFRDYLYSSTANDNLWDGQWGILRAYNPEFAKRRSGEYAYEKKLAAAKPEHDEYLRNKEADDRYAEIKKDYPPRLNPLLGQERLSHVGKVRSREIEEEKIEGRSMAAVEPHRSACPPEKLHLPQRRFTVEARQSRILYNANFGMEDPDGIVFVKTREAFQPRGGSDWQDVPVQPDPTHPLVLRAAADECVIVKLENRLPEGLMPDDPRSPSWPGTWSYNEMPPIVENFNFNELASSNRVSLHPQLVEMDVGFHDGSRVGYNTDSTVPPGRNYQYEWYAGKYNPYDREQPDPVPIEFGATALRDLGDAIKHSSHGAVGALVIEPKDSRWTEDAGNSAAATVTGSDGHSSREFVVIYQDDLSLRRAGAPMPNLRNGDDAEDSGQKAFNYRTEPLWARVGASDPAVSPDILAGYDFSNVFSSLPTCADGSKLLPCADGSVPQSGHGDPETPVFTAKAGEPVRFRVVHAGGHPRQHGFTVFGHSWPSFPWTDHSSRIGDNPEQSTRVGSASGIGPLRHLNIVAQAGGSFAVPGDYLFRTQEGFQFQGGLWGLLRVCRPDDAPCLETRH